MKTSESLSPDSVYTREDLKKRFGIVDATINNGVFHPKGHDSVWLFITEEKTSDRTAYLDKLDGDDLRFQGQTMGRTDGLIINHERDGTELLVFYRKKKYEYSGAGFRYEGPFRYASHSGSGPANFLAVRLPSLPRILLVTDIGEVRQNVLKFNLQTKSRPARALNLLQTTHYWVCDSDRQLFGPSKFVAFDRMTLDLYERIHREGAEGDRFDGAVARNKIERLFGSRFVSNDARKAQLRAWATERFPSGSLKGVDDSKWAFVVLPPDQTALEVEVAAADAAESVRIGRGQGFNQSPEARKAIENAAMDRASRYFEALGYTVVQKGKPFDLSCQRGTETLQVEVKGTQGDGVEVILTPNEVEFARRNSGTMCLFILSGVVLDVDLVASGGQERILRPWRIDDGELNPISYMYAVPVEES